MSEIFLDSATNRWGYRSRDRLMAGARVEDEDGLKFINAQGEGSGVDVFNT